jgi:hypothetical protein
VLRAIIQHVESYREPAAIQLLQQKLSKIEYDVLLKKCPEMREIIRSHMASNPEATDSLMKEVKLRWRPKGGEI